MALTICIDVIILQIGGVVCHKDTACGSTTLPLNRPLLINGQVDGSIQVEVAAAVAIADIALVCIQYNVTVYAVGNIVCRILFVNNSVDYIALSFSGIGKVPVEVRTGICNLVGCREGCVKGDSAKVLGELHIGDFRTGDGNAYILCKQVAICCSQSNLSSVNGLGIKVACVPVDGTGNILSAHRSLRSSAGNGSNNGQFVNCFDDFAVNDCCFVVDLHRLHNTVAVADGGAYYEVTLQSVINIVSGDLVRKGLLYNLICTGSCQSQSTVAVMRDIEGHIACTTNLSRYLQGCDCIPCSIVVYEIERVIADIQIFATSAGGISDIVDIGHNNIAASIVVAAGPLDSPCLICRQ